jgi:trimeric autotransporter adhesin
MSSDFNDGKGYQNRGRSDQSGGLSVGDDTYTSTAGTVAPANGAMIQGFVGIGTTKPVSPLNVVAEGSNGGTSDDIRLESYGPTHAPALYMVNARGTYAAPANLANGDSLGV